MAHLLDYETAERKAEKQPTKENFVNAALSAIDVVERKNSKRLAWSWAETAAEWAEKAGIAGAYAMLGHGRWPEVSELAKALAKN